MNVVAAGVLAPLAALLYGLSMPLIAAGYMLALVLVVLPSASPYILRGEPFSGDCANELA